MYSSVNVATALNRAPAFNLIKSFEPLEKPSLTDEWGVQMSTEDTALNGLTLVIRQSGEYPAGELLTGSEFWLEQKVKDKWSPVKMKQLEAELAWTCEAYNINRNDITKLEVQWEWLYGNLTTGEYRIGKRIMNFRETGDYDERVYYAYFQFLRCGLDKE